MKAGKEYKSRKNRRKYNKKVIKEQQEERKMNIEEKNLIKSDFDFVDESLKNASKRKNNFQRSNSKERKIFELYQNVEAIIEGKRQNNMVCCSFAQARKITKKYNVKLEKKETVNLKYGLCMFKIIP